MKTFTAEVAVLSLIAFATIMLIGPLASPGTLAFKIAMRIYIGV